MAVAHGKNLSQWFRSRDAIEMFNAVSQDLGVVFNPLNLKDSELVGLSAKKMAESFPNLIVTRRGAPENGCGTWLHPDIALHNSGEALDS